VAFEINLFECSHCWRLRGSHPVHRYNAYSHDAQAGRKGQNTVMGGAILAYELQSLGLLPKEDRSAYSVS
jgi:hypothetical protein